MVGDTTNEKHICKLCCKELGLMDECDCEKTQLYGGQTVIGKLKVTEDKNIACECGNRIFGLMKVMFNEELNLIIKTAECKECKSFIMEAIEGDEAFYDKIIEDCERKEKEAIKRMKSN